MAYYYPLGADSKMKFKINLNEASTQRALICLPFILLAGVSVVMGKIEAGVTIMGMAQTASTVLKVIMPDSPTV